VCLLYLPPPIVVAYHCVHVLERRFIANYQLSFNFVFCEVEVEGPGRSVEDD